MANRIFTGGNTDNSGGLTQGDVFDFKRLYEKTILINEDVSVTINEPTTISGSLNSSSLSTGIISSGAISSTGNISASGSITTNGIIGNASQSNFRGNDIIINGAATVGSLNSGSGTIASTGTIGVAGNTTFSGRNMILSANAGADSMSTNFFSCDGVVINAGNITTTGTIGTANNTSFRGNNIDINGQADVGNLDVSNTITTFNGGTTHSIQGNMGLSGNLGVGGNITVNFGSITARDDISSTGNRKINAQYLRSNAPGSVNQQSEIFLNHGSNFNAIEFSYGPAKSGTAGSVNRRYRCAWQGDGNVVVYDAIVDSFIGETAIREMLSVSDSRLKTNISETDSKMALTSLMQVPVVHFDWTSHKHGLGRQIGFLAQDVEKFWPEVVITLDSEELEGGKKTLNKDKLVPMAWAAIQELKKQLDSTTKQLDSAVKQIDDLKKQITL